VSVRGERTGKWDAGPAADADVAAGMYVCMCVCMNVCVLGGKSMCVFVRGGRTSK